MLNKLLTAKAAGAGRTLVVRSALSSRVGTVTARALSSQPAPGGDEEQVSPVWMGGFILFMAGVPLFVLWQDYEGGKRGTSSGENGKWF